jgi:sodium/proline symporter
MPEFFANRFLEKGSVLRVSCAVIFVVGYCIYAASSIVACGKVLNFMVPKLDNNICMIISAIIIAVVTVFITKTVVESNLPEWVKWMLLR